MSLESSGLHYELHYMSSKSSEEQKKAVVVPRVPLLPEVLEVELIVPQRGPLCHLLKVSGHALFLLKCSILKVVLRAAGEKGTVKQDCVPLYQN